MYQYVPITAFPLQQWLPQRASGLRYMHNARFVETKYIPMKLHPFRTLHKTLFDCPWLYIDLQSGLTNRNVIYVDAYFFSFCVSVKYFTR